MNRAGQSLIQNGWAHETVEGPEETKKQRRALLLSPKSQSAFLSYGQRILGSLAFVTFPINPEFSGRIVLLDSLVGGSLGLELALLLTSLVFPVFRWPVTEFLLIRSHVDNPVKSSHTCASVPHFITLCFFSPLFVHPVSSSFQIPGLWQPCYGTNLKMLVSVYLLVLFYFLRHVLM